MMFLGAVAVYFAAGITFACMAVEDKQLDALTTKEKTFVFLSIALGWGYFLLTFKDPEEK